MIAVLDGDAVLHCADSEVNPESCHRVRWVRYDGRVGQIILSKPKMLNVSDAERAEWSADGKRQHSLSLTKVQLSDNGLYSCEIWRGWDRVHVQNRSLVVKGQISCNSQHSLVEKPCDLKRNVPLSECSSQKAVKAAQGTPVNLSCLLDMTTATLRGPVDVFWEMLKAAKPLPITSETAKVNGTSLSFSSVAAKDQSWYRCTYTLGEVRHCYDINLQVQGQVMSHYKGQIFLFQGPTNNKTCYYYDCASDSDLPSTPVMVPIEEEEVVVQQSIKPLAAALTVVVAAMAAAAAAAGVFVCRRRSSRAAAPRAQGFAAGPKALFMQLCSDSEQ